MLQIVDMAFDKDLRPLNVSRTLTEEPRIVAATTTGRNIEGFFANPVPVREQGSPGSIPVFLPAPVSDAGFVGLGYGNQAPAVSAWCTRGPAPVGHAGVNPLVGFGYSPSLVNRVVNAVDQSSNEMMAGFGCSTSMGNRGSGNGSDQINNDSMNASAYGPNLGNRSTGNLAELTSEEGGDDSVSGKKVKFLCSFGGRILPRPSDGMLRYVGGLTRIISVRRDVSFDELVQKMVDTYGNPVVIKYQLPDEDLDALVSVSCPDDLDNMMEEYEKLLARSSDGSVKLRLFLFSSSELDPSGMVQFGDLHDSGQRYVEAVNGIMDGFVGGIMRKESIASATSTQNSHFSGAEVVDGSGPGQGDFAGISSPKEIVATSLDAPLKAVSMGPNSSIYADGSGFPTGIPTFKTDPPQTLLSPPEVESERPVPLNVQQQHLGFDFQQHGVAPPATYVQPYVDPRQEVPNQADYLHLPSQMGFPNPQILGNAGSTFTQAQFRENAIGVAPPHFIPAVPMTVTAPTSHAGRRPVVVQPLVQPQQTLLERYPDESTLHSRVLQLPVDHNYIYQSQVPTTVVGAGYSWHQPLPSDRVVFSNGLTPHQQVNFPEKIQRLDDCLLCQKALPHAHSDTIVPEQRDSGLSPMSDSGSGASLYHSFRVEDGTKIRPLNKVIGTGPLGEGIIEQGAPAQSRVLTHLDHPAGVPQSEATVFSRNLEAQQEKERSAQQRMDNFERPATHGATGLVCDLQSPYGVFMGPIPESPQKAAVQPQLVPTQYQVKNEHMLNKHLYNDVPQIGGLHVQASESLIREAQKEYSVKIPVVPKEDNQDASTSYGHLRPVDGMMQTLQISSSEIHVTNGQNKSPVDRTGKEEILDNKHQQVAGREMLLDNTFSKPPGVIDINHIKPIELLPSSSTVVNYVHNSRPAETYEVSHSHVLDNPGLYQESKVGDYHLDSGDVSCGRVAYSVSDPAYSTAKVPAIVDWKDDVSWSQPEVIFADAEAVPLSGSSVSSLSPPTRSGEVQDSSNSLFSNQDPWNLRHGTHFPPPRPNKIQMKKEVLPAKDHIVENHLAKGGESNTEIQLKDGIQQLLSNSNKDCNSEQAWSAKDSAEELIKQELQAVAEGVAASVFQSSIASSSDLPAQINDSVHESNQEKEISNNDLEKQPRNKIEEIRTKLPVRANIGFPVSNGVGRLQIIKSCDLEEMRELGSGTFGTVYHGKWRGTDVAIKRINDRCFAGKPSEQERMIDDFWNEAIKLADLHHPNVVAFYGVVLDGPGGSVATVTEFMVNGSLRNALQKSERNLDKRKRLLIAMDVAFGMEYLHGKNIVHFDLKSDNLLVNLRDPHRPICKVGDLGLSKVKCQTLISGGVRGTLPWMAPELLNGSSSLVSEKVDVFSFGIVMWELLTGEEPYADLHYGAIIGGIVSNTLRPPVPESCDPGWRSLMERCWSSEPSERPSFTEIANELRSIGAKIPSKGQSGTQSQVQK